MCLPVPVDYELATGPCGVRGRMSEVSEVGVVACLDCGFLVGMFIGQEQHIA
jgi:hypothetical protein